MLSLLLSHFGDGDIAATNYDTFEASCVESVETHTQPLDPISYEMRQMNFQPFNAHRKTSSDAMYSVSTKVNLKYQDIDKRLLNYITSKRRLGYV